jgi:hypothetical protein
MLPDDEKPDSQLSAQLVPDAEPARHVPATTWPEPIAEGSVSQGRNIQLPCNDEY